MDRAFTPRGYSSFPAFIRSAINRTVRAYACIHTRMIDGSAPLFSKGGCDIRIVRRYATYFTKCRMRAELIPRRGCDIFRHAVPDGNPCSARYCGAGRECQVAADGETVGETVCVCVRRCARRHRPVCASNGRVYANHCELHRAACNAGMPLTTRRLSRCLSNGEHVSMTLLNYLTWTASSPWSWDDHGNGPGLASIWRRAAIDRFPSLPLSFYLIFRPGRSARFAYYTWKISQN